MDDSVDDLRARSITELLEQIARRNVLIEQLRTELTQVRVQRDDAEYRATESAEIVSNAERDLAQARSELASAQQQLRRITTSRGYRGLQAYRSKIRRIAPPGTTRNKIYRAVTWPIRRMGREKRTR